MKISELASRANTTTKTIRFYEQTGLLPAPNRSDNSYRDFDDSAAVRIGFIRSGQALGLTLAQIRELLTIRDDGRPPCLAATQLIDGHIEELTVRIREMQALRRTLREVSARAQELDNENCPSDSVCHIINPNNCSCGTHTAPEAVIGV